ncbi:MAG TPA: hypothetical protein VFG55_04785 [Rhodanobacteraceae bacterium]|nr:hypothetical protein [Rhodanobacteraceae bacterium]
MKHRTVATLGSVAALVLAAATFSPAQAAEADLDCKLTYSLTGWAAIYKHAEGHGVVRCENGETMSVRITAKGGGLTVGKSHIDDGKGTFTDVHRISDVLGSYAQGEASVGAGKSAGAHVMTKGTVSLALAGKGEGVDIGVSFGAFTISPAK